MWNDFCLRLGDLTWRVRLDDRQQLDDGFRVYLADAGASGPELVVSTDDALSSEPPDVPALEHQGGVVRFRGQCVRWQGELPLDRVETRAAAEELVLHRALLPWMCTRMTYLGQGMLMHGALVRGRGGAWLLIGGADVGKSTACRLVGDRSLSTNIAILRKVDDAWWAWTMPVVGENEPASKEPGPFRLLGAIVLERGEVASEVVPVGSLSARIAALGKSVVAQVPNLPECTRTVIDSLTSLVSSCPVHRLAFRRDAIHLPE